MIDTVKHRINAFTYWGYISPKCGSKSTVYNLLKYIVIRMIAYIKVDAEIP